MHRGQKGKKPVTTAFVQKFAGGKQNLLHGLGIILCHSVMLNLVPHTLL